MKNDCKCIKETELGILIESSNNFKKFMDNIEQNHLKSIYEKLDIITEKLNSRRPTYTIMVVITLLSSMCTAFIVLLLK